MQFLRPIVIIWAAASTLALAAPAFVDLPAERTGLSFGHSFDEQNPRAFLYHAGFACGGACIGDVNGDQLPDLYFADGARKNALYLNKGDLRFEASDQEQLAGGDLWGTGAALVDIDADGDLDLCQANYDAPIQFFRNDGKGMFTEVPDAFGIDVTDASLALSFADADNDGDLDVYILCNEYYDPYGRPATPPFVLRNGVPVAKEEFEKYYLIQKDHQGNWTMDNYGRADYLFLNEGSRTEPRFRDVSTEAGVRQIGHGLSCLWLDHDRDGDLDLYVANDFLLPDRLYRNDGVRDGIPRFTDVIESTFPALAWSSMGCDLGDINNDGLPDVFVAEMSATTHFKSKLNMGKMIGPRRHVLETGWPRQAMRNHLFIHNGSPMFSETARASGLASSDWSWAPKLADFDNDGLTDLFIANGITRNFTDSDHGNTLGDINQAQIGRTKWDLYKDLAPMREANIAFRNIDGRRFEKTSKPWGLDHVGLSYNTAYGDLDRDGDLDLVVSDLGNRSHIFENRLATGNSLSVHLEGSTHNRMGIGAKVTVTDTAGVVRTRWMQPWTGFQSQNDSILHFGLGSAKPATMTVRWQENMTEQTVQIEAGTKTITVKEQPGKLAKQDAPRPWFVECAKARGIDFVHQERQFDEFARQPLLPGLLSQFGPALAAGDVDGDGDADLFAGGATYQAPAVFINEGGSFRQVTPSPFPASDQYSEDLDALWFDADGDGDLDLYVVSGSVEVSPGDARLRDRLFLNQSQDGTVKLELQSDALPALTDSGSCVAAADYDADGDLDLFVGTRSLIGRYPLTPPSRLLRNESTKDRVRFVETTKETAPGLLEAGLVTGSTWTDFDRDGDPDLLVSAEWGPVRLFVNDDGKLSERTSEAGLAERTGWWSALTAADIDGDGDDDYLLGNVGWNTKYKIASTKKPALLYYGDMDGSGTMRLVEAKNAEERLLPVRGKSCSTAAMPSLGNKLPTYRKFAMTDLPGIYSQQRLDQAAKFAAVCFESGILINETSENGPPKFRWSPMPWEAQLSIINDIAVANLDGRPGLEILCAQNHYTREPETGLWRGNPGCLLRWNNEAFTVIPHPSSGLLLAHDVKALETADFDGNGSVDVAAGQNNNRVLLFLHQEGAP